MQKKEDSATSPQRKKTFPIATVSIAIGVILTILIVIHIINRLKTVPVNDSDLIYKPQEIVDQKNAYFALLPALKEIQEILPNDEIEQMTNDESSFDYVKTKKLTSQYSSLYQLYSVALKLEALQLPANSVFDGEKNERYIEELIFLQRLAVLNVKKIIHEKNFEKAYEEILKLFKYGYLMQNSGGSLITFMIGNIAKRSAYKLMNEVINKSHFEGSDYLEMTDELKKFADNNGILITIKKEYTDAANLMKNFVEKSFEDDDERKALLEEYKKSPWRVRFFYNESETLNELAEVYRQEIRNASGDYASIKHKEIDRISGGFPQFLIDFFNGNIIGKLISSIAYPNFDNTIKRKFELDVRYSMTKLLLALKSYHVVTGTYPDSLDELIPDYIDNIPIDSFNNDKIKYSRNKQIIYSAFFDGNDDQGDGEKDLIIKLNFN